MFPEYVHSQSFEGNFSGWQGKVLAASPYHEWITNGIRLQFYIPDYGTFENFAVIDSSMSGQIQLVDSREATRYLGAPNVFPT